MLASCMQRGQPGGDSRAHQSPGVWDVRKREGGRKGGEEGGWCLQREESRGRGVEGNWKEDIKRMGRESLSRGNEHSRGQQSNAAKVNPALTDRFGKQRFDVFKTLKGCSKIIFFAYRRT